MKTIAEAISDLLYVRDTVVVPGLGAFVKKPTSAEVNTVANYFTAPSCVVEFDDDLREDNDLIVNYIAGENDIPDDEARRLLAIFVSDCFNKLKNGEKVVLNGIGTLRYDWHSDIVLEQDASCNYNSDAFGLCDFTAVSVVHSATKDEIKAEIEQQQWEKNTPVTVDEKAVHQDDDEQPRRPVWPWILLALLLLAGVVLSLQYFHVYDFRKWFVPNEPVVQADDTINTKQPIAPTPIEVVDTIGTLDTIMLSEVDSIVNDSVPQPIDEVDTTQNIEPVEVDLPTENVEPVEETSPVEEEGKILVVAGCFSVEEYAQNMLVKLKEEGHQNALLEKHGNKWFVAYGRYRTQEEAKEAYKQLRAEGCDKAWIRN